MSKDNKRTREKLEAIYGKQCMLHKGLNIKGYSKSKISYSGRAIREQLTLHHIKPRSKGGSTSVENGAVLCRGCHDFLEQTDSTTRAELNKLLIEYKKLKVQKVDDIDIPFTLNTAELSIDKQGKLKLKRIRADERKQEKREMQKLKKFYEDR